MTELTHLLGQILSTAFDVVYLGIVLGTIVVLILDNRNPVKTLAWVLVLLFLPYVGLVFYFFFGRSQRRERIISRKGYNSLLKKPLMEYHAQEAIQPPEGYEQLVRFLGLTNQALPFSGNRVDTYTNGYALLQAMLADIGRARHHIHLQTYIMADDPVGRLVRDALLQKAAQGVEVRVLYDDVGCWHVPYAFFEEMRMGGIDARSFLKVRFPLFTSRVNYRNHRKILVVDGRVGFVGGMNLAERYVRGVPWGCWRDTHLRIEGKAVHGLQTAFLRDWFFIDRTLLTSAVYFPPLPPVGDSLVQVATSDPVGYWRPIMQAMALAIGRARRYLFLQTPYFLPTDSILSALQTAALSGVDVRLMLPQQSDSRLVHLATCSYVADVLRAGVKVYLYRPGFLHSKLLVSDDLLCSVGSTNIDFRSFEHNFEVNAFIYDPALAHQLRAVFVDDQRRCLQLSLKKWERRPARRKALESFVRLLSPLL